MAVSTTATALEREQNSIKECEYGLEKFPLEKGLLRDEWVMALLKDHSISNSFFCVSIPPWCLFVSSVYIYMPFALNDNQNL